MASPGRVLMRPHHRGVDRDQPVWALIAADLQRSQDLLPRAICRPAAMPVVDGLVRPEPFRQIPPRTPCPHPMEYPIDDQPVVRPPPSLASIARQQRLQHRPLLITEIVPRRAVLPRTTSHNDSQTHPQKIYRTRPSGLSLYGRKLWEAMSSYWPTGDQQPDATPAQIAFAQNWRDTPKVVFSSTIDKVDWNTRLVTGDAVEEITRLKAEDGGPMGIGGARLAGAAMRAGLIDEYALATYPVLVGGGTPFFTALDSWVSVNLVETRTFPGGVVLTRYETRR